MNKQYQSGAHLQSSLVGAIAQELPPGSFAAIMGSATFGGFHPGRSDIDVICWETTFSSRIGQLNRIDERLRLTTIDARVATLDPGFGRTLEAHNLITAGRLDVLGNEAGVRLIMKPTAEQLFSRRQLELQMVIGWISKESRTATTDANWYAHRKLVLRATKIEARLRNRDMYSNDEAESSASERAAMRPSKSFLSTHLEWLGVSLVDLLTSRE